MNVDSQFPQPHAAVLPGRPVQSRTDQASARPVERPHHNQPSNNQTQQDARQTEAQKDTQRPANEHRTVRQESELSPEEKRELEKLKARDRDVRAHEAAHKNAAGSLAQGGAQFEFQSGPDGKRYAVGGEVSIDTSKVAGDPQATLRKAQTIRQAANAPAQPSAQDRNVALMASQMEAEARQTLAEQRLKEQEQTGVTAHSQLPRVDLNRTEPVPLGELLDVTA